ncbi:MAG TPA: 6-phospho-beta-glucosidase [Galbitalea sp.]|jgi:6-phospho-beta-glucosidase|nr:6-phospho-beta-glucosidase [Galbitalea sp.]
MKLAIVGGGSTYTPELVDGLVRMGDQLPLDELWLVDPDPERLDLITGMSRRMLSAAGHRARVHATPDLVAGVSDADIVLFQLRVGGQAARHGDETWPHVVHCIGQETTGPGGFAKALRTVPIILEAAEAVRRYAKPDAWIIDFTNPVGIVTRALLQEGHHAVGLCNAAIGFQRTFARLLEVDPSRIELRHVGLNHLTWEREALLDGADVLPRLLRDYGEKFSSDMGLPHKVLELLGQLPSYYLRYYYSHDRVLEEQLQETQTRAEAVMDVERELLALYADPTVTTKPDALARRGGAFYSEAAIDLMASLNTDRGDVQVVNLSNNGSLPFLPDDHVIEVSARVTAGGVEALPVEQLPDGQRALISAVAGYERLALDAAIHGGRDRVLRAMQAHPLVLQYDRAEALTDLLISNNSQYLPWAR